MKAITVRLPAPLVAAIENEAQIRGVSMSAIVRERLEAATSEKRGQCAVEAMADFIGSVDGLPMDLSARTKAFLKATGYGKKRTR